MKKYNIVIEETLNQEFEVFAKNKSEAIRIAINKYQNDEFILCPGELTHTQLSIIDHNKETDWIDL